MFHILQTENGEKIEYRVWNPFRSKLAAAILGGVDKIYMPPGSKVLYLGAASGTTVSHVADVVGPVSLIYIRNLCKKDMRNHLTYAYIRAKLAHNYELGVEVMLKKLHARSFQMSKYNFTLKKESIQQLYISNIKFINYIEGTLRINNSIFMYIGRTCICSGIFQQNRQGSYRSR